MLSKLKTLIALTFLSAFCYGQIPILNSYPAISNKVIYLDFDGQKVTGTSWNGGNTVNAVPSTLTAANIIQVWKRMCEDYRPFDVNITTDSLRFNSAPANKRIRVVITSTSAWYPNAGGVAFVGSFTFGGTPGTPCWVFEDRLSYSAKNIAEAASHEVGHTLTLRHHSIYSPTTCSKTAEYNPGVGTGVTSWAPIMGVGYSKNVTIWHFGQNATSCSTIQYDLGNTNPGLLSNGYLSFLPDDVGDTYATSKILNLNSLNLVDSGLISQPTDMDAYQFTICNNRYVSIGVKPWALDTNTTANGYQGANLDVRFALYNSSNNLIAIDTSLTRLHTLVGVNLTPGTYYFTIDGGRSANYTDYGSLGRYYIRIKATNPPALVNSIVTNTNICSGQATTLNYSSNGSPTQWQWTVAGPTATTFATQNPNIIFSAGMHTISLLATNPSSMSCVTMATLNVNSPPVLSFNNSGNILCPGKSVTLAVSGATSYTWLPGSFSGSVQIVNPAVNTTYTVQASNGTCNSSTVTSVTVNPDFTLSASASATEVCEGDPFTLSASGASSYTFLPGNLTGTSATYTPAISSFYFVSGQVGACTKTTAISIIVSPHYIVTLNASDSLVCPGQSVTLIATGTTNYTFSPGGLTGYSVIVNPTVTTIYTVTAEGNGACIEDTSITIGVKLCDFTGLVTNNYKDEIRVYPNPSHGFLLVESSAATGVIEITNALGQKIYHQETNSKTLTINTGSWPNGIYFVKLFSSGEVIHTEKILVE